MAFELSEDEFAELKARCRTDRGSLKFSDGLEAVPRSGKRVVAHFAHRSGEGGSTEPETIHHVNAKRVIRDVASRRGWDATIEARNPDGAWQADVLLQREGRSVAFEAQWSHQELSEYERRTARYAEYGLEVVWLARYTSRTWSDIEHAVPALPFQSAGAGTHDVRPLEEVIDRCLGYLETEVAVPEDAPRVLKGHCYRCGEAFGYHPFTTRWQEKEPLGAAEAQALGRWAGRLAKAYSKTARAEYEAWHCPHCGRMQGDFHLSGEPFALVGDKLVPDTRGRTLWQIINEGL